MIEAELVSIKSYKISVKVDYGLQGINEMVHVDFVSHNLKNLEEIGFDVRQSIESENCY